MLQIIKKVISFSRKLNIYEYLKIACLRGIGPLRPLLASFSIDARVLGQALVRINREGG